MSLTEFQVISGRSFLNRHRPGRLSLSTSPAGGGPRVRGYLGSGRGAETARVPGLRSGCLRS